MDNEPSGFQAFVMLIVAFLLFCYINDRNAKEVRELKELEKVHEKQCKKKCTCGFVDRVEAFVFID